MNRFMSALTAYKSVSHPVLPDTTFGPILSRENQGDPSTAGLPVQLLTGGKAALNAIAGFLPPRKSSHISFHQTSLC